jgi:hypothetical protein
MSGGNPNAQDIAGAVGGFTNPVQKASTPTSAVSSTLPTSSSVPAIQPSGTITPNTNNIASSSYPSLGVSGMTQPPIPQFSSAGQGMPPANTGASFAQAMGKGGNGMGLPQANFPSPQSIVQQSPLPAVFGGKTSGGGPNA